MKKEKFSLKKGNFLFEKKCILQIRMSRLLKNIVLSWTLPPKKQKKNAFENSKKYSDFLHRDFFHIPPPPPSRRLISLTTGDISLKPIAPSLYFTNFWYFQYYWLISMNSHQCHDELKMDKLCSSKYSTKHFKQHFWQKVWLHFGFLPNAITKVTHMLWRSQYFLIPTMWAVFVYTFQFY